MNKTKPFTKLFASIVTSSIWTEDAPTRVLWVTMLAICDADGDVWASVGGLARTAGITREECEAGLAKFLAPDPDSRTQDNEGRRIVVIDGGWRLLNYKKYRQLGRTEDRREYFAEKKREQRSAAKSPQMSTPVHTCPQQSTMSPIAEAEAEAEAEAKEETTHPPTPSGGEVSEGKTWKKDYEEQFEQWWEIYRRKGNKIQTSKQWDKLTNEEKQEAIEKTPAYVDGRERKYQKDGERFIRDRCWQDEHEEPEEEEPPLPILLPGGKSKPGNHIHYVEGPLRLLAPNGGYR
jgi:hypothetical protein